MVKKKYRVFLLALPLLLASCCSKLPQDALVVGRPTGVTLQGLGVELDPHFLSQNVAVDSGAKAADWDDVILKRLKRLRFQKLRVMVLPYWYEPQNDDGDPHHARPEGFTFGSAEMDNLYRLLDYAEREQLPVTLTFWGASSGTFLLRETIPNSWMCGPDQLDEWAENVSVCLRHLLDVKGYTCIREVTPVNEPDWSCQCPGSSAEEQYVAMCKVLDERLRKDGLRQRVGLNLSDNSDGGSGQHGFLQYCVDHLGGMADIFNSHTYIFGYDTPNDSILSWERHNVALAARCGKQHFVGEFGSNQTVGATVQRDIDRYERGLLMSRIAVNLMNAGAVGASYWSLLDQYYSQGEARSRYNMQKLGLWRYLKDHYASDSIYPALREDYQVRPQYYAMGLLCQAFVRGGKVYPLETGDPMVCATAVRLPKAEGGKWRYVIVNPTSEPRHFTIVNRKACSRRQYAQLRYLRGDLPAGDELPQASGTFKARGRKIVVDAPPESLTLVSEQ